MNLPSGLIQLDFHFFSICLFQNTTSKSPALSMPQLGDARALYEMVTDGQILNLSKFTAFAQENVGTFVSVSKI